MMNTLIALALVGVGYWVGKRGDGRMPASVKPEEQEQQRLQEDRAAFSQLMGYNAERAYGLHGQE